MRVFDRNNNKIYAGHLVSITDSSLFFVKNNVRKEVQVKEIYKIKMKHSAGHPMLIGGGISAVSLAVITAATAERDVNDGTIFGTVYDAFNISPGAEAALSFLAGAAAGTAAGAIIGAVKKKPSFIIDNDIKTWGEVKSSLQQYLPEKGDN